MYLSTAQWANQLQQKPSALWATCALLITARCWLPRYLLGTLRPCVCVSEGVCVCVCAHVYLTDLRGSVWGRLWLSAGHRAGDELASLLVQLQLSQQGFLPLQQHLPPLLLLQITLLLQLVLLLPIAEVEHLPARPQVYVLLPQDVDHVHVLVEGERQRRKRRWVRLCVCVLWLSSRRLRGSRLLDRSAATPCLRGCLCPFFFKPNTM